VQEGERYRLVMNKQAAMGIVHSHRHTFEVTKVGQHVDLGIDKGYLEHAAMHDGRDRFPGRRSRPDTMDEGFAGLITYS
jgi:hypothetical protein